MAALIPSFAIRPGDPSKLVAATHYICGNKVFQGLDKLDLERKFSLGVVAQSSTRNCRWNIDWKASAAKSRIAIEDTENSYSTTEIEGLERRSAYRFLTEVDDGQVKVIVGKKNKKYVVSIEVSSLQLYNGDDKLILSWGVFRSDSSRLMNADFQDSVSEDGPCTAEALFVERSSGSFALKLEFEANRAPFYLSFILKSTSGAGSGSSDIRSHRRTNFCVPVGFGRGYPSPLGLSFSSDGSPNFALFSRNAGCVVLCLYDGTSNKPSLEIDLDPYVNRTGDVWHASMESVGQFVSYGYRCKEANLQDDREKLHSENVVLDPYAKLIRNNSSFNDDGLRSQPFLGELQKEPSFSWNGDVHPHIPMEKLVVYRLNVTKFTKDASSQVASDVAGTFSGMIEKLQHFKDIGVNAVLLEPIFSFDEQKGPYFPFHFFSPMHVYGPSSGSVSTINSMKEMVKRLHDNGIEVLLEVVFTYTSSSGALQGIDDSCYYYRNRDADSGTRNALNCNYPIVQQMILDSLRYWVTEFHIDGFCFINASSLLMGFHGERLTRPPLVETITFDPILSKTKIIADCWDPRNMEVKKIRFPHWKRWAEMNTRFCNGVRNFLRGEGLVSDLATRLCGSGDIFTDGRGPAFSFNFISKNFGLPLVDLVSFSSRELASELSWNCGKEGPTNNTAVLERRLKQIRNFLFILFVSLGVPILNMGDECGHSSGGSPAYGDKKAFNWDSVKTSFGVQIIQFISFLSSLRSRRSDLLQRRSFLKEENIDWFASDRSPPTWDDPSSKFLALRLKANMEKQLPSESLSVKGDLFMAFNADDSLEKVILPPPPAGMVWHRLVDTALPFPGFFTEKGEAILNKKPGLAASKRGSYSCAYQMESHSCALFEASTLGD